MIKLQELLATDNFRALEVVGPLEVSQWFQKRRFKRFPLVLQGVSKSFMSFRCISGVYPWGFQKCVRILKSVLKIGVEEFLKDYMEDDRYFRRVPGGFRAVLGEYQDM